MTAAFAFEIGLAAILLVVAVWTVAARTAFTAIVAFVVYGLLLSIVWVGLSAIDIALTEAAIGSGVTGMLLLGASARLRATEAVVAQAGLRIRIFAGMFCGLIAAGLAVVFLVPPDVAVTLAPAVMDNLAASGLGNPVAGVLFVYRGFDTLLEKIVLLIAVLGVWSFAPDRLWGGIPGLRILAQSNGVLPFLAQVLPPLGIVVGIYMFWVGAADPGGAFQGGSVLAAMWVLVLVAGLQDVSPISRRWLRLLMTVGPLIFIIIGYAGFLLADAFLAFPAGYAKPLIIVVEAALTLSIGVTLALLAEGPPDRMPQQ